MNITLGEITKNILFIVGIAVTLYYVPYLIRKGWGDAENRTKKVCDICWRDIKKIHDKINHEQKN